MTDKYILRGHDVVPVEDLIEWAVWFETHRAERIVKQEHVGGFFVSTVFLGLDHNYARSLNEALPPLVFETMVFKPSRGDSINCERCSTWDEAIAQHDIIAAGMRKSVNG